MAVGGAVDKLQPLARAAELHGVLSDDIAAAGAAVGDRTCRFGARRVHLASQGQRSAGRRVLLAAMVLLDNVAVPVRQGRGHLGHGGTEHGDTQAEIGLAD